MAENGESTDKGGRPPMITDKKLLEFFIEYDDPVYSAPELAEELPISKTGVYKRLVTLDERGLLNSKKIGPGKAFWITQSGIEYFEELEN